MKALKTSCPLSCGAAVAARVVHACVGDACVGDAGGIIVFICPECLGVAFDAAILADPRHSVDLTRVLRPIVETIRREDAVDPLTQTKTRAFFFRRLTAEIEKARDNFFISVAAFAFDLDDIHRKLGARRADSVVRSLASSLLASVRTGDDVARIEPDSFALILRHIDAKTAAEITNRIVKSIHIRMLGERKPLDIGLTVAVVGVDGKSHDEAWRDVTEQLRAHRRVAR